MPNQMLNQPKNSNIFSDRTMYSLLVANVINGVLALAQNWSLSTLIWVYFFQSIFIGIFTFIRMIVIATKNPITTDGTTPGKGYVNVIGYIVLYGIPFFFLFHYGMFHFVYAIFLGVLFTTNVVWGEVLFGSALFAMNHIYSYIYYRNKQKVETVVTQWLIMKAPYVRILPMHLTIILFGILMQFTSIGGRLVLIVFLVLKTVADIQAHRHEHAMQNAVTVEDELQIFASGFKK